MENDRKVVFTPMENQVTSFRALENHCGEIEFFVPSHSTLFKTEFFVSSDYTLNQIEFFVSSVGL